MNKKKVRGWKRQIRKLEQWKQNHLQLSLNRYGYEYVKIWLDPWYRLQKRNPPIWFRRLIVAALIEIYAAWHKQLVSSGEPFYLKIWFFEPHFIQSQVVAATGERVEYYENLFVPDTESKKFPFVKYAHADYDLTAFDWQLRVDEDFYFKQADEFTDEEFERLKKKAFRVEQTEDGDTMLTIKRGNIFVGERTSNK
jgi:hypothetical protein